MYVLILTLTTIGLFSNTHSIAKIDGFKSEKICEIAGEQFREEHKTALGKHLGKYKCIKVN